MTDPRIRIAQYGRRWFSAYTTGGRGVFLAMGESRRQAEELAVQKLPPRNVSRDGGRAGCVPGLSPRTPPALAAATGTAKTAQQAECEASQSGPKGNAQTQSGITND